MSDLGSPLVVYTALAYCDTALEHEVRLITDGHRAYAYGTRYGATDCPAISRNDANLIRVDCGQDVNGEERCTGQVRLDLGAGDWISATSEEGAEALDLLKRYGQVISQ
jgi:hypothetical protein